MNILCHLTDWETKPITRGRGVGGDTTTCVGIGIDSRDMVFGLINKERPDTIQGPKSYGTLRLMIPAIKDNFGIPENESIQKIADALRNFTKTPVVLDLSKSTEENALIIEKAYNMNYHLNTDPRKRIFGETDTDDSENTE